MSRETEDDFAHYFNATARLSAENGRLRKALQLIAAMRSMTLIAPSMGPEADHGHQVGANKAFNQAAEIALDALAGEQAATPTA